MDRAAPAADGGEPHVSTYMKTREWCGSAASASRIAGMRNSVSVTNRDRRRRGPARCAVGEQDLGGVGRPNPPRRPRAPSRRTRGRTATSRRASCRSAGRRRRRRRRRPRQRPIRQHVAPVGRQAARRQALMRLGRTPCSARKPACRLDLPRRRQQRRAVDRGERVVVAAVDAESPQHLVADRPRGLGRHVERRGAALRDRPPEQAAGRRRAEQRADAVAAGRLAGDGDRGQGRRRRRRCCPAPTRGPRSGRAGRRRPSPGGRRRRDSRPGAGGSSG